MPREYWRTVGFEGRVPLCDLEFRAALALKLVEHFGGIAGKRGPEAADGKGDPGLELQTPEELVARCFRIAEVFVETAEERNLIRIVDLVAERKVREDAELQRFEEITQRRDARAKERSAQDKAGA